MSLLVFTSTLLINLWECPYDSYLQELFQKAINSWLLNHNDIGHNHYRGHVKIVKWKCDKLVMKGGVHICNTEPCGIPDVTGDHWECSPLCSPLRFWLVSLFLYITHKADIWDSIYSLIHQENNEYFSITQEICYADLRHTKYNT